MPKFIKLTSTINERVMLDPSAIIWMATNADEGNGQVTLIGIAGNSFKVLETVEQIDEMINPAPTPTPAPTPKPPKRNIGDFMN